MICNDKENCFEQGSKTPDHVHCSECSKRMDATFDVDGDMDMGVRHTYVTVFPKEGGASSESAWDCYCCSCNIAYTEREARKGLEGSIVSTEK